MARRSSRRPSGPSPFDLALAQQQHEMFDAALGQVPAVFREVLVLRFQEQMKLEEIAQLIHIPLATVKTQNLSRRDGLTSRAEGRHTMTNPEHERAIDLIARRGVEDIAAPDAAWLESHLALCSECAEYAGAVQSTGQLLRSVAVTASPALVTTTQARVRARATYLQEQRSRMVLIAISFCIGAMSSALSAWLWWRFGGWVARTCGTLIGDRRAGNPAVSAVAGNRDRRLAAGVSSSHVRRLTHAGVGEGA